MDDTRRPSISRIHRRALLPFFPAALTLGGFALLAVWPRAIPGLPPAPRLLVLAALLALILLTLASRGAAPRRGPRRARPAPDPASMPAPVAAVVESPAWLQVVSGPDAERLTRGVIEIASALVAGGERVLVVDGARRLRAHEALLMGGAPGLLECLAGELPVLEAIQGGAEERLCLLPRGNPMRPEAWPQLGRLLLEARPRFDRVVLALDFAVPAEVGPALVGLGPAAWWCPDSPVSILSMALAERIGIALRNIELPTSMNALHEFRGPASAGDHEAHAEAPAPQPRPGAGAGLDAARAGHPPVIVDCDLQVRERLRFLVWMRGLQAEGQREIEAHH